MLNILKRHGLIALVALTIVQWHHMKQYIRPLEQIYAHIERSLKAKGTQSPAPDKHENLELVKSRILFLVSYTSEQHFSNPPPAKAIGYTSRRTEV